MPTIYRNKINYGGAIYLAGSGITAGIIVPYGGSTAPTGWLLCDGSAVSRTGYSQLFEAIGTTYGSGDGSTTFNLPDLRGSFPVGASSSINIGTSGGEATHTLNINEIPSHVGHLPVNTGGHQGYGTTGRYLTQSTLSTYGNIGRGWDITGEEATPVGVSRGGGQAHNNMPPYTAINYIISIGSQNGGFTPLSYDGTDYQGGIDDDYLLLQSTISKWSAILGTTPNIDQITNYLADNLSAYKSGDTYTLSTNYLFGAAGSAGTTFYCTAFTPKIIPQDISMSATGLFTQIHSNGGTPKTNIPIDSVQRGGDNILMLKGTSSGLGSRSLLNCVPNIVITFN